MQLTEYIVQFVEQLPSDQQAEALNYILELGKKHNNQVLETILKYLPQIVSAIALVFAVIQYKAAQKWKRLEYAATVLSKINTDEDLILAVTFLDWRQRDICIPKRFLGNPEEDTFFKHTHLRMAEAFDLQNREKLNEHGDIDLKNDYSNTINFVYVETFDKFFSYLEQINSFINMGLIKIEDVSVLNYLANRIYSIKANGKPVFRDYLEHYRYDGVLNLINNHVIPSGVYKLNE